MQVRALAAIVTGSPGAKEVADWSEGWLQPVPVRNQVNVACLLDAACRVTIFNACPRAEN